MVTLPVEALGPIAINAYVLTDGEGGAGVLLPFLLFLFFPFSSFSHFPLWFTSSIPRGRCEEQLVFLWSSCRLLHFEIHAEDDAHIKKVDME